MLAWMLVCLLLTALVWPLRFHLLVRWGKGQASWEMGFWSRRLAGGRLRDVLPAKKKENVPKETGKTSPAPPKARKPRRPGSLRRLSLRLWKDREDVWSLFLFSNRTTLRLLDAVTVRARIVLAGLDPMDQGWLSVLESARAGAGWLRKLRILNDWDPDASGGAIRWDLGFCLAELVWFLLVTMATAPWRILWKAWRDKGHVGRESTAKPAAHAA